jgi:hypothetical protein
MGSLVMMSFCAGVEEEKALQGSGRKKLPIVGIGKAELKFCHKEKEVNGVEKSQECVFTKQSPVERKQLTSRHS